MRNPNGYGSVVKLSGNRRRPYVVRKTIGWNEKGHPVYQIIDYCETRKQGLMLLAEFNKTPYNVEMSKLTVSEVFEKWFERAEQKLNKSTASVLKSVYKYLDPISEMRYKDVKAYHMQQCIDNCNRSSSVCRTIKNLFYHLDKFALEFDIINKANNNLIVVPPIDETNRVPFSLEEIKYIEKNYKFIKHADTILVLLYSGWRISEMLSLKRENIDFENMTMKGGCKTKNGKNRIVPIHPKIKDILICHYNAEKSPIFDGLSKGRYYVIWDSLMKELKMNHTPHECRHSFRSRLDSAGGNASCINLLMGHKSLNIGERVYTHKTLEELKETILLLD